MRCSNMAEAMGFELMDLLQSTVFKTDIKTATGHGLEPIFLSETFSFQRLCRPHSIRPHTSSIGTDFHSSYGVLPTKQPPFVSAKKMHLAA